MKFIFFSYGFLFFQSLVLCSRNESRKTANFDDAKWNDFKKLCTNLRTKPLKKSQFLEPSRCLFMVPGLSFMEHGAIQNFFYENFEDFIQPKFEKIFSFTCEPRYNRITEKFRYYDVPYEVYKINENFKETREKRILSVQAITQELIEKSNDPFIDNEKDSFSSLPIFLFNENSTESVGFLRITASSYEVQLRNNIKPNKRVMKEYRKLPEHWRQDVKAYYKFLMRFGTHIRQTTKFGGSLFVLVPYGSLEKKVDIILQEDDISVNRLLKDLISFKGGNSTKLIAYPVGGSIPLESIKDWIKSVHQNPIPIESTFIPLNKLLDSTNSVKSRSLAEFIEFEKNFQTYKKTLYNLKLTKHENSIAQKVYELVKGQLKNVCPSKHLNKLISDSVEKENNFRLDKFWFTCQHSFNVHFRNRVIKYLITPHLCFSYNTSRNDCFSSSFSLPKDMYCIEFFGNPACVGDSWKIYKAIDMADLFQKNKILSYRICEADASIK